jgi:CRP-like cAMP-binding protein
MNPAELFQHEPETLNIAAGDFLFHKGDAAEKMYVLLEGTMEIMINNKVVEKAERGALLGEIALIDNSPRSATIVATSPCRLAAIDRKRFHFLIQQNPYFATHVMQVLAARLRNMDRWIANPS